MKTRSLIFAAASVLAFAACTSEDLVNVPNPADNGSGKPMSFMVGKKNITRADSKLETMHTGFGVWAMKTTGTDVQDVMDNYLVGWGGKGGYNPAGATTKPTDGTDPANPTVGLPADNLSWWFYEGLGTTQYKNTDANYVLTADNPSGNTSQYLKYWDYSSSQVEFFAYVPYSGTAKTLAAEPTNYDDFDGGTVVFSRANGGKLTVTGIWSGFDNPKVNEHLLAYNKVVKNNYAKDVDLRFKRTNGEVRLSFWEDIAGYKVSVDKIQLQTARQDPNDASGKTYITDGSAQIVAGGDVSIVAGGTVTWSGVHRVSRTIDGFTKPSGTPVAADAKTGQIAYNRITQTAANARDIKNASFSWTASPNVFYCVPADQTPATGKTADDLFDATTKLATIANWDNPNCGFLVTLDYTLYSEDTNERIKVTGAKVFVGPEYTQWEMNKRYLYVFKLTKNTNGYTDPDDPHAGLYPIVFDNITVQEIEDAWTDDKKYQEFDVLPVE